MDDQRDAAWADAMLRRPAVDPGIPAPDRALLTAPGTLLTPACRGRPPRNRDYLPADPDKRGATGQPSGRVPASVAARTYHGRYLTAADFDAPSRVLLRRAQDAADVVTSSEVYRAGLLDQPAVSLALAGQEWDIAVSLREQARLRAARAGRSAGTGPQAAAMLDRQVRAARIAEASVAGRVAALEGYAAEVRGADVAYRDWLQARALVEVSRQHLDMLARTAADEHGIAELDTMSRQARAVRRAFGDPPG
jgi:hypothetical protein